MSGTASTPPHIAVRDLQRSFGKVKAVQGVTFEIARGEVVGFIGANGAGKTTTMRIMATLESPDSGSVEIGGYDVVNHPVEVRHKIGWMPDNYGTYNHMTVWEYLDFYGRAFGFKEEERVRRTADVMAFTDLTEIADRPMNKLSKGMGQRLCLGRTLLHDPEVLLLDEPAAGLDPKARIEFKRLVRLLAQQGKTIFISSHILTELGEMCDSLVFIHDGRIVHHGSAESLQERQLNAAEEVFYDIQLASRLEALPPWVSQHPGLALVETRKRGARLRLENDAPETAAALLRSLIMDGFPVTDFHRESRRLEDAFVDMLKNAPPPLPVPGRSPDAQKINPDQQKSAAPPLP